MNVAYIQSVFSRLSQGLEGDILESSLGRWADTAGDYCPGRPLQIVLKFKAKYGDRREKMLSRAFFPLCRKVFKLMLRGISPADWLYCNYLLLRQALATNAGKRDKTLQHSGRNAL